ncbi:hypothetical protein NQZ68_040710 [Dissostichus eleginoides]|nr:hypothetical protein NQZ68_040710 [Dissostichus eleginoides]
MWSRPGGRHYVALPARHRGATQREAHSFPLSLVLRCGVRGGVSPGASPTSAGTPSLPKRHPRVAGPRRNAGSAETESPPAAAHAQRRARRGAPRPDPKTPDVRGGKREFAPTERREDQVARANRTGHPETSALRGTKAAETACDTPAAEKRERFFRLMAKRPSDRRSPGRNPGPQGAFEVSMINVTSGRSVPLRPEPQRGEEALNPSRLPPEEAGESGTRRRTADGQGGAAAPHWSQCSEFFSSPVPVRRGTEHPAGTSGRPPRAVPSSLGRGGEVGVFHLPVDRRGERPAREPGLRVSGSGCPRDLPFYSRSASSPRGGREERSGGCRNSQSLPLGPTPRLGFLFIPFSTDGWGKPSSLIVFSALRQDRDRSRRGRSEDLTKPSNRVARVQPRTSKGITDLLLLNLVWLNATCPSKKLDADRTGPRNYFATILPPEPKDFGFPDAARRVMGITPPDR